MISCTAASIHAVLAFIDPTNTPKIAYDRDDLALPLIAKLKASVGDYDGSQIVAIHFSDDEHELQQQFSGICKNLSKIFDLIHRISENEILKP